MIANQALGKDENYRNTSRPFLAYLKICRFSYEMAMFKKERVEHSSKDQTHLEEWIYKVGVCNRERWQMTFTIRSGNVPFLGCTRETPDTIGTLKNGLENGFIVMK
jgi:hypothetical protein